MINVQKKKTELEECTITELGWKQKSFVKCFYCHINVFSSIFEVFSVVA